MYLSTILPSKVVRGIAVEGGGEQIYVFSWKKYIPSVSDILEAINKIRKKKYAVFVIPSSLCLSSFLNAGQTYWCL